MGGHTGGGRKGRNGIVPSERWVEKVTRKELRRMTRGLSARYQPPFDSRKGQMGGRKFLARPTNHEHALTTPESLLLRIQ